MLKHATDGQNETFARLKLLLGDGDKIKFTLVGAAACREYGLTRATKDLDIVVSPYPLAMTLLFGSGQFQESFEDYDPTHRTCTQIDMKTSVPVDFLTGGIRISDGSYLLKGGESVVDRLPIPLPSGFGNLAPLSTVIGMKLSAVISGVKAARLDETQGVRSTEKILQDIADVRSLASICNLPKSLSLGDVEVQRMYETIYDGGDAVAEIL